VEIGKKFGRSQKFLLKQGGKCIIASDGMDAPDLGTKHVY